MYENKFTTVDFENHKRKFAGALKEILGAPFGHIINPLLTKHVRSRWLDIGLVLFLRFYGPRLRLGP